MRITFAILCCIVLCGCGRPVAAPPADLVEAVKQKAFALPKEHEFSSDGTDIRYAMIVRQVSDSEANRQAIFPTNDVQAEWYHAHGIPNPERHIAKLKEIGGDDLFAVHFFPEEITSDTATIRICVNYSGRGGKHEKWTFGKTNSVWTLSARDRTLNWD